MKSSGDGNGDPPPDAAAAPDAGGVGDGGPAGPQRYVDLLFASDELVVVSDIHYATVEDQYGSHRLLLDLWRPGDGDPISQRPVMVWVHGGQFRTGDRTQMAPYARKLPRRGYVAVSVDYRLLKALDPDAGPQAAAEVAQEDVDAAIAYLTAHADEHGIDPTRFLVGGFSAGSITSFQVGYRYEDAGHAAPHVIGVTGLDGFLVQPDDLEAGDPPFILIRSSATPPDDASGFAALLAAADDAGIAHDMVIIPDTVHIDLVRDDLVPAISAIVAPFLHAHALGGAET